MTQERAATIARIDIKTGEKYRNSGILPSEINAKRVRGWRTKEDPIEDVWPEAIKLFEIDKGLKPITVFEELCRKYPEKINLEHRRTFYRRVAHLRSINPAEKEIYFDQIHYPGKLGAMDFTCMNTLGITINKKSFPQKTNPYSGNENGDAERSHSTLKDRLDQRLRLRENRDFNSESEYREFVSAFVKSENTKKLLKLNEEIPLLKKLPDKRQESCSVLVAKVSKGSVIKVKHSVYSVPSFLIGAEVKVLVYSSRVEVYFCDKLIEKIPRLQGKTGHFINYRHIIHSLVKKPGAFADYRYHSDLFPSTVFRQVYDYFLEIDKNRASANYLKILLIAAEEDELSIEIILQELLFNSSVISAEIIREKLQSKRKADILPLEIGHVEMPDLLEFDSFLEVNLCC